MRWLMAVSRALCFATGGPQPSGQSASFKLCPPNYSGLAPADTIIKSVSERPINRFLPGINSGAMFACPGVSHSLFGAGKSQFQEFRDVLRISDIFSEFLKYF